MADLMYDPGQLATSPLFQTRFWIADTVKVQGSETGYLFADGEILWALGNYDNDPILAGADLLQALANDKAKLAIVATREGGEVDASKLSDVYTARAQELRNMADVPGSIDHKRRVFTLGRRDYSADTTTSCAERHGTMDIW